MLDLSNLSCLIKALSPGINPAVAQQVISDWLDAHPEATTTVQDGSITEAKLAQDVLADLAEIDTLSEAIVPLTPSATSGDVGKFMKVKTVSGGKVTAYEFDSAGGGGSVDLFYVTPEDYGAVGDGETDDSQAVQDACDAGYAVYFASNKTYYLASNVNINHDCHLFGGENTVIKTESVTENGTTTLNNAFFVSGTLKKTTTLTTDYSENGNTDNSGNRFTLSDMTGIDVGDLLDIVATDQYYSYARQYYYLGGTLMVANIYDGHIYTSSPLPFDIENTGNVTVKIYDAPSVTFENLNFVSDRAQVGFRFFIEIEHCKNSTVKNCTMRKMWNGMRFLKCFNSHAESVIIAESKYDNDLGTDSYGICIESCSNTKVENVHAIDAQNSIDLTGTTPNFNTYIRGCTVSSECRGAGIGMHENNYNIVVEDCEIGGMSLYGNAVVNRCKIFNNRRVGLDSTSLTLYGSHNERYANFHIYDCEFTENEDKSDGIGISRPLPQTPISSFDNVVGEVVIRNCRGGILRINPDTDVNVTSNKIKRIEIDHWRRCHEIFHTDDSTIDFLGINETTFIKKVWINKHSGDNFNFSNVGLISVKSTYPQVDKLYVDITEHGGSYVLPSGVAITFTSNDSTAHYIVCGRNIASNNPSDYRIGSVSGGTGDTVSFTENTDYTNALSVDQSGNLVVTRPNKTTGPAIFPKYMLYIDKQSAIKISAKIKNIGETDGQGFRAFLCIVDADTGKITYRNNGESAVATEQGVTINHSRSVPANSYAIGYLGMYSGIANAITEISDFYIEAVEMEFGSTMAYEPFQGSSRTGDGTLTSIEGKNNIMCSPASFSASFKVDKTDV